jgi:intergrase/recombinase
VRGLRDWFCQEVEKLGVPDRYIDTFCGRVPRSVLARHYTDFSPEKLKEIYDKANLKVLS